MRSRAWLALSVAFVWLTAPVSTTAQIDDGCVTSACHPTLGTGAWVHGPVGVGACKVCHSLTNETKHTFRLTAREDELCFSCHDRTRDMKTKSHLHAPVATGDCVSCHDPHQTDYQFSLKAKADDLCLTCHDRNAFEVELVHGPATVGDCNACHNPHASNNTRLLVTPEEKICTLCHDQKPSSRLTLADAHR